MLDIHCHILPGVDDGSAALQESLEMARQAVKDGVSAVCATPHFGFRNSVRDPELFDEVRASFCEALRQENIPLTVYSGMELYTDSSALTLLREGRVRTLNGTQFLLVEFDFGIRSAEAFRLLDAVQDAGCRPVLAHAERFSFVQRHRECLYELIEQGIVVQLNKGSLYGAFGATAAETALWAVNMGCVHVIASDAHSPFRRTTRMAGAYDEISERFFPELADLLFRENPLLLCSGQQPPAAYQKYPIKEGSQ